MVILDLQGRGTGCPHITQRVIDVTNSASYRSFPLHAGGDALTRASPEAVWSVLSTIGGENRYFVMNGLWTVREWIDALVGGEGMTHRRPPEGLTRVGQQVDSWRVTDIAPPNLLALEFGMKAPGDGVLEFTIAPVSSGARLNATAWFDPDGLAGRLYWAAMKPAHLVLFDRLTAEIARRAADSGEPDRVERPAAEVEDQYDELTDPFRAG